MVFQAYTSFGWLTVRENVEYGLRLQGVAGGGAPRAVGQVPEGGRPRRVRRPLPEGPLGRHEAARGDRAHAHQPAARRADGRAVRRARPADALGHAGAAARRRRAPRTTRSSSSRTTCRRRSTSPTPSTCCRRRPARILHRVDVPFFAVPRHRAQVGRRSSARSRSSCSTCSTRPGVTAHDYVDMATPVAGRSTPPKTPVEGRRPHAPARRGRTASRRRRADRRRAFATQPGASIRRQSLEKRPYLKFAFANPYNLSLFVGALAAAGLTLNPVLAVAALGARGALAALRARLEAAAAPAVGPAVREGARGAARAGARRARMTARGRRGPRAGRAARRRGSGDPAAGRRRTRRSPATCCAANSSKTDRLVDAFLDMAVTCARYEQYLASVDVARPRRASATGWERRCEGGEDARPAGRRSRRRTSRSSCKRLDKMQEIRRYLDVARGQLDLIENSFQLIADQIVTMQSPQELSGQLDELLDGVESIRAERGRHRAHARLAGRSGPRVMTARPRTAARLGRGPPPPLPARRGVDVRPPRQRLRRRRRTARSCSR